MTHCTAELRNDSLTLSTGVLTYSFDWNEGHLTGKRIENTSSRIAWDLTGEAPDCEFPNQPVNPAGGFLEVDEFPGSARIPPHLRAQVTTSLDELQVKRVFRLYPNCPLIGCDLYLRGRAKSSWRTEGVDQSILVNIENRKAEAQGRIEAVIMHRVFSPHQHLYAEAVEFRDITDRNNNLVVTESAQPYRQALQLKGNILFCRDRLQDRSIVILKEAPCSSVQLASPGFDFSCRANETQIVGIGVMPGDIDADEWTRCYGFAIGVTTRDTYAELSALRTYQEQIRVRDPERDEMILVNTWSDRGQDTKMNESFVFAEIDAAKRLGATHFQLDHGWETTQDAVRTWPLDLNNVWATPHFWDVHPARFPNGLAPCVQKAKDSGIELCIWFNPSADNSYKHWRDDANVLIGMHKDFGIRTFKIDGVQLVDKTAEINFRRMLDKVIKATGGDAVFNLDVTAGKRFGYHYFNEYGNYFLENRYTDWSSYYPHWTLRNLWMLSRYVPAQSLQIEFLNKWRNSDKYPADDPLAPHNVPFDYCFAITMMAQPLAWFEAGELPEDAFGISETVRMYREHMPRIHSGQIFPIGNEPSGAGWTGFQSIISNSGYFLIYRELNSSATASLRCWNLTGRSIRCTHVAGYGKDFAGAVGIDGTVTFSLPGPHTFALYQYAAA